MRETEIKQIQEAKESVGQKYYFNFENTYKILTRFSFFSKFPM